MIPSESARDVFTWERLRTHEAGYLSSPKAGKTSGWPTAISPHWKAKEIGSTSARESAVAATRQVNSPAEVNTKQAKSEAFLLLRPFILVATRRCQPHPGKVVPDLLRSSRPSPIDMPTDTPTDQLGLYNPSLRVFS